MRKIYLVLSLLFFLFSCSKRKVPKDILGLEKMQAVYWDYMRADVFANEFVRKDSSKNPLLESAKLQNKVFALHKISKETFYKSYEYYLGKPLLLKELVDTMLVRQPKIYEEQQLQKRKRDSIPILEAL